MNRTFFLMTALSAGLISNVCVAQTTAAPAAASAATLPAPQAVPAKIALVAFEQAVFATNEGQKAVLDLQKKYEPRKAELDKMSSDVDALKKQLNSAPATMTADDKASRLKAIDAKEKALTRSGEDAQTAYNAELQELYGKLAGKFSASLKDYVAKNGYTLLLDVSGQGSNVMWASTDVNTDVTKAAVDAYNASSGVAAPAPSAPSASRPTGTAPRTTPRPAGPK